PTTVASDGMTRTEEWSSCECDDARWSGRDRRRDLERWKL
ncbi:hypothetical protein A2U01_0093778, partial [Trifolium medium]|nr:hypothetical protein [Trifolium medium]